jgi:hypothetical protein
VTVAGVQIGCYLSYGAFSLIDRTPNCSFQQLRALKSPPTSHDAGGSGRARFSKPDIFNTDQDSQFTGGAFTGTLIAAGIRISMDGLGSLDRRPFHRTAVALAQAQGHLPERLRGRPRGTCAGIAIQSPAPAPGARWRCGAKARPARSAMRLWT